VLQTVNIPKKWLVCLFLLAVAPRLLYLASIPREAVLESVDAKGYDLLARNLLAGHGFSQQTEAPFHPDGLRTPLYPLFLAAIYTISGLVDANADAAIVVALAQILLDTLSALIVAFLAAALFGRRTGITAGVLYALAPIQWRYSAALLPEIALAFLITLAVWLLTNLLSEAEIHSATKPFSSRARSWAAGCGMISGLIALCKPNVSGVGVILAGSILIATEMGSSRAMALGVAGRPNSRFRSRVVHGSIILLAAAMVMGPWIARNWVRFGRPFLSHAAWGFLARVSAPATLGIIEDHQVPPWSTEWEARYHLLVEQTALAHAWDTRLGEERTPKEMDAHERQLGRYAWEIVTGHPAAAMRAHFIGYLRSWAPLEPPFWYTHLSGRRWEDMGVPPQTYRDAVEILLDGRVFESIDVAVVRPWKALDALARVLWYGWGVAHLVGIGLFLAGLWKMRHSPALATLMLLVILYATLPPGPIAYARFRVSVMPLIVVVVAPGVDYTNSALRALWLAGHRGILAPSKRENSRCTQISSSKLEKRPAYFMRVSWCHITAAASASPRHLGCPRAPSRRYAKAASLETANVAA
jgi:4-amino-4-deoxy-L-arabinose transferase-like glycosyltransferase